MSSPIQTAIIAGYKSSRTMQGGGVLVKAGSRSTMAIVRFGLESDLGTHGVSEAASGTVRALYSELGDVSRTEKIEVNGKEVFITSNPSRDTVDACIMFEFSESVPSDGSEAWQ